MLRPSACRMIRAAGVWAIFVAATARGGEAPRAATAATKDAPPKTRSSANGSKPGRGVDSNARRAIAGGPTSDDVAMGAESAENPRSSRGGARASGGFARRRKRLAETELRAVPIDGLPRVNATGLPASVPPPPPPSSDDTALGWLDRLELPICRSGGTNASCGTCSSFATTRAVTRRSPTCTGTRGGAAI